MTWSLRRRLTATVVVTTTLVLVVMAVVLYVGVRRAAWRQHDQALVSRARAIAAIAEHEGDDYEMVLPRQPATEPVAFIEVWRPDGTMLLRSDSLAGADLPRAVAPARGYAFEDIELPDHRAGRSITLPFLARDERDPQAATLELVLAEGTEDVDAAVASMRAVFIAVGVLSIALIAGVTLWVLVRGTRPLARLATEIERIDDRQLATRLSSVGHPAELEVPVNKLNELLVRLERSFTRERELTADIGHELRTPLAALRTLLEVTALADRSTAEYRAAVADALGVVKQMAALVENLLTLARLDAGQLVTASTDVELRALVDECWADQRAVADARGVAFENSVGAAARLSTDRGKLKIVIGNLLANAAQYTERGGWIAVTTDGGDVLTVTDSGPPVPADQLAKMFERFWRGDVARAGDGAHAGIGLALSRSLCERLSLALTAELSGEGYMTLRIIRNVDA